MSVILQGLEGNAGDSNEQLRRQLDFLYNSFVMYCGSIVNIRNVGLKFSYQYNEFWFEYHLMIWNWLWLVFQIVRNTIFFSAICWRSPGIFTRTSRYLGHTVSMWLLAWQLSHSSIPNTTYSKHSKGKFSHQLISIMLYEVRSCPLNKTLWTIFQGKGEVFLQASNILQSSQRRPGVLVGLIMYKNR